MSAEMAGPPVAPVPPAIPPTTRREGAPPALVLAVVVFTGAVYASAQTIALVALPQMPGDLSAGLDQIAWVVTANIVASAVGIPPTAWLAARFGRKRVYLASLSLFALSCLLLGTATSLEAVIAWRVLQGLAGAPLLPLTQSIALDAYPRARQGMAMSVWSVGVIVGPVVAPALGGWLTDIADWRLIFLAMLAPTALAFAASLAVVPGVTPDRGLRFDWFGFVAITAGIGAAQLMLDRGQRLDWFDASEIVVLAAVAAAGFYVFLAHVLTARAPFLDPRIFADRNFSVGLIAMFAYSPLIYIPLVLLPNMLDDLRDYPVVVIGLLLVPRGLGQVTGLLLAGPLVARVDCRRLLAGALLLQAATSWIMSRWDIEVGLWDIVWPTYLQGCAMGLIFMSIVSIIYATLGRERRTEAAALFSLVRNFGTSVGISLAVAAFVRTGQAARAQLVEHATPANELLRYGAAVAPWDIDALAGLAALERELVRHADMVGYAHDFFLMSLWAVAIVPLALLARDTRAAARAA